MSYYDFFRVPMLTHYEFLLPEPVFYTVKDVMGVQPMTGPTGLIFSLKTKE